MSGPVLLISDHRIQVHVFNAFENIGFNEGVVLFQCSNQLLGLKPFRRSRSICMACCAGVCNMAGTLQKMQAIIISPGTNVAFPDQIHRPDQFHPFKICAMQLWHHGLDLAAVQHSHQDSFYDIIVMMSQSNLIAAQIFRLFIQTAPSHPGTDVAGIFIDPVHGVNISLSNIVIGIPRTSALLSISARFSWL